MLEAKTLKKAKKMTILELPLVFWLLVIQIVPNWNKRDYREHSKWDLFIKSEKSNLWHKNIFYIVVSERTFLTLDHSISFPSACIAYSCSFMIFGTHISWHLSIWVQFKSFQLIFHIVAQSGFGHLRVHCDPQRVCKRVQCSIVIKTSPSLSVETITYFTWLCHLRWNWDLTSQTPSLTSVQNGVKASSHLDH